MTMGPVPIPAIDRLMRRVVVDSSGCWLAPTAKGDRGYSFISTRVGGRKVRRECSHRVAFEWARGRIPSGLCLDHLCRQRNCVNPWHLRAVTTRENVLAKGSESIPKQNIEKTHCKWGHEFTHENTIAWGEHRSCRECSRRRSREWKRRAAR